MTNDMYVLGIGQEKKGENRAERKIDSMRAEGGWR
jgi:hypothetical protein